MNLRLTWMVLVVVLAGAPPLASAQDQPDDQDQLDDPGLAGRLSRPKRQQAPAAPPAPLSKPVSKPAPQPSPAAAASSGSEDIADPDDEDGWSSSENDRASATSPTVVKAAAAQKEELLTWWARATVRMELDTGYSGPRSEAQAGIREDVMALLTETSLSLQMRPHKKIRLQAGGRLRLLVTTRQPEDPEESYVLFNGSLHRTDFEVLPGEMLIELSTRWVDLQAGMLRTVWGANDLVNPNDVLTAKDLRMGLTADAEVMRLPVLSFKAELYVKQALNLSVIWQPVFAPHSIELFGSDYALLGAGAPRMLRVVGDLAERMADDSVEGQWQTALVASNVPRPFADSNVALRVAGTVWGWDLAAQYVYGFERLPVLRLHGDLVRRLLPYMRPLPGSATELLRNLARSYAHAPPVESVYLRQHQVGISFSRVLWRLVIDGDGAFVSRQAEPLGDGQGLPLERRGSQWSTSTDTPVLSYTLGARYAVGQELLIKLEWWHELLLDQLQQAPAERADLLLGGPLRGGLALLCRYAIPRMDVTLQLMAHSELFHGSVVLAPQLEYRVGEHLALLTGATIYAGSKGPGALYDDNDNVHFGLKGVL